MRSTVGLCVLGLLGLHCLVFGQEEIEVHPGVLIFCDDPSVVNAAHSAVLKFNKQLTSGNKLALYNILSASKLENGSVSVYSLKFTSRRTDCPASSCRAWTDCDYLPINRPPISCNATVYMIGSIANTGQVDCELDDYIVPERISCLGCPVDVDLDSEDLKGPLFASISKYNSLSDSTHLYTLNTVAHATRQVIAGFRFKLRFDMRKTTCAKAEHTDLNELCVPDEEDVNFANCNSTVDVAPWRLEPPQTHIECGEGPVPPMIMRRLPPGFSPLRNFIIKVPATSPSPSQASAKEESSEEDTTASKPSASPDVDPVTQGPFHCPSRPWKPFNPPAATTAATIEDATLQPAVDGGFSDADLLL